MEITPAHAQLITASVALVAVFISPYVSIRVARAQIAATMQTSRRQIEIAVLSKNRQEWINALRREIAEFLHLLVHAHTTMAAFVSPQSRSNEDTTSVLSQLDLRQQTVRLMLNPREQDHRALLDAITSAASGLKSAEPIADAVADIAERAQQVLKREWERVKEPALID